MTDLVIFDCDGVLVDSEPLSVQVDIEAVAELGLRLSRDEVIERFVGRSKQDIRADIEAQLGHAVPSGWFERADERLREAWVAELRPVAGVEEALELIDTPSCVASSSEPAQLRFKLELTGLYERFAGRIFSATEVPNGKPAPDLFLHAAARMGAQPERCVVVEDSRHGVEAARAAGMRVLAFVGGGLTPASALAGPRTTVFEDMRSLPGLIS